MFNKFKNNKDYVVCTKNENYVIYIYETDSSLKFLKKFKDKKNIGKKEKYIGKIILNSIKDFSEDILVLDKSYDNIGTICSELQNIVFKFIDKKTNNKKLFFYYKNIIENDKIIGMSVKYSYIGDPNIKNSNIIPLNIRERGDIILDRIKDLFSLYYVYLTRDGTSLIIQNYKMLSYKEDKNSCVKLIQTFSKYCDKNNLVKNILKLLYNYSSPSIFKRFRNYNNNYGIKFENHNNIVGARAIRFYKINENDISNKDNYISLPSRKGGEAWLVYKTNEEHETYKNETIIDGMKELIKYIS